MSTLALAVGAALAVARVVRVARPFLLEPAPADDRLDDLGELDRRRADLAEERDQALAALKELEFDHRTGTITDEDYRRLVGPLRRQAAEALRALEPTAHAAQRARDVDPAGGVFGGRAKRRRSAHDPAR